MIIYFNIIIIVIIGVGGLLGYIYGANKSKWKYLIFIFFLILGWIVSPSIALTLMKINLSSSFFEINIFGEKLTNLTYLTQNILTRNFPGLSGAIGENSLTIELIEEITFMSVRMAVLLIWVVIIAPILKLIISRINRKYGLKIENSLEKKWKSKLIGSSIGIIHALTFVFLISIPLSGICSIGSLLSNYSISNEQEEIVFLKTNNSTKTDLQNFMNKYRSTVAGKISGTIKISNHTLDEHIFDELFSVKYLNERIKIRNELFVYLKVYNIVAYNIEGEITLNKLMSLDEEVINEIFSELRHSESLHLVIPIAIEISFSYILTDQDYIIDLNEIRGKIKTVKISEELNYLERVFVIASKLDLFNEENDIFYYEDLDDELVITLIDDLSNLELINIFGPYLSVILMKNNDWIELYQLYNIEHLAFDNIDWNEEIKNFGTIYQLYIEFWKEDKYLTDQDIYSFSDALFSSKVFMDNSNEIIKALLLYLPENFENQLAVSQINSEDLRNILCFARLLYDSGILHPDFNTSSMLTYQRIEKMALYISSSKLLSSNVDMIVEIMFKESSMSRILTFELPPDVNWNSEDGKTELMALLTVLMIVRHHGTRTELPKYIDYMTETIINSTILTYNMDNILQYLIKRYVDVAVELDLNINDWSTDSGNAELRAVLSAVSLINKSGLLYDLSTRNLSDGTIDTNEDGFIDEHDDNIINELAVVLSSSIVIKENLNKIIASLVNKYRIDIEIIVFDDPQLWSKIEIESILYSIKILESKTNLPNDLILISDSEIDTFLKSVIITNLLISKIIEFGIKESSLVVNLLHDDPRWKDTYNETGEIRNFISAIKTILKDNSDLNNINLNANILKDISTGDIDPSDDDLTIILKSIILTDSLINQIKDLSKASLTTSVIVVNIDDDDWMDSPSGKPGELRNIIRALQIIFKDHDDLYNIEIDPNIILNMSDGSEDTNGDGIIDENDCNELEIVLRSKIISDTVIKILLDSFKNQ